MKHLACGLLLLLTAFPLAASAQSVDLTPRVNAQDPLGYPQASISATSNGRGRLCIGIINLTNRAVSSARIHFAIVDQFGSERVGLDFIRNFSPALGGGSRLSQPTPASVADTNDGSVSCWTFNVSNVDLNGVNSNGGVTLTTTALAFGDGQTWQRGTPIALEFNRDGTFPQFAYARVTEEPDRAPVRITSASVRNAAEFGGGVRTRPCASFRNVSNKVAASVTFVFILAKSTGGSQWLRYVENGTFTPPVLIEEKCGQFAFVGGDVTRQTNELLVRVTAVRFTDGTGWQRGQPYTKGFTGDGQPYSGTAPPFVADTRFVGAGDPDYAQRIANLGSVPFSGPPPGPGPAPGTSPAPNPLTPGGIGGVIGPSGQLFGDIAWVPGMSATVASATDKGSVIDAGVAAMEVCRARAGAQAPNCQLLIKGAGLNSPASRCASLVFDGSIYRVGFAPTPGDAELNALTDLRNASGDVARHQYLATICNLR